MSRASIVLALACLVCGIATSASAQRYRRPVACSDCIANWYYFDEDPSGADDDWNCAGSSYDGHRGSDFSLRGGNGAIDTGYDVVAAADGMVVSAVDGFFDRCTSCPASGADPRCGLGFGGGFGNHVAIQTGSDRVYYAHMRMGSVRVSVGDRVTCGQVIGQIASSGCTTGAHLHFETRAGAAYDPFEGPCSPTSPSRWVSQGAHRSMPEPTCDGPAPPTCPSGWYTIWTCEGSTRRRCIDGVQMTEECGPGSCESRPVGTDDVCDADADTYATDEGDCDDRNASVHPGASEVCGNGVDDDCSGGDVTCPVSSDASVPPMTDAAIIAGADAASLPGLDARTSLDASGARVDAGTTRGGISSGCSCRAGRRSSITWVPALLVLTLALAFRRAATQGSHMAVPRGVQWSTRVPSKGPTSRRHAVPQ
jgi:hypothetical protein